MDRRSRLRLLLGLAALVVATGVGSMLLPAAEAAPPDDPAGAAVAWLAGEAPAGPFTYLGQPDWGLTADAVLAAATAGSAGGAAARWTGELTANATDVITFGVPGVRSAGGLAKLLLVAEVMGLDPGDIDGWDLPRELLATMVDAPGPNLGRFSDIGVPDGSNAYGQALGVLALARSAAVPPDALAFLVAQQCPGGGFRAFFPAGGSCTLDAAADGDTTAVAIQALLAEGSPSSTAAAGRAADWLVARQGVDGSLGGSGPTAAPNANSTALAAQAFSALGRSGPAGAARSWVAALQLGCTGAAVTDAGAVAYGGAAFAAAEAGGIAPGARDQFRRTTAQAVLGLSGVSLVDVSATGIADEPVPLRCDGEPGPPATAPPTTAPDPPPGDDRPVPPPPPAPDPAPPVSPEPVVAEPVEPEPTPTTVATTVPTTLAPPPPDPGPRRAGSADPVVAGTSRSLAFTGSGRDGWTLVGVGLVVAGAALAAVAVTGMRRS